MFSNNLKMYFTFNNIDMNSNSLLLSNKIYLLNYSLLYNHYLKTYVETQIIDTLMYSRV